jgi:glycosyltransferase involved in cell wall biosynthesis
MPKTRIVIPCYNEAKRLEPRAFLAALDKDENLSFLFVNDGSTDETLVLLTALQTSRPEQVGVLTLDRNAGKAEAVRRGMLEALAGPHDYIGYWDADLATPLDAIGDLCSQFSMADVDLVIGSRVRLLGRKIERNAMRHYLGRVFATCAALLLGISVYDTQCGAKVFRNNARLRQVFNRPFTVKWTFDLEMLARIPLVQGLSPREASTRWVEYPLDEWIDAKGSKVTATDYVRSGLEFALLYLYLKTPVRRLYTHYLSESRHQPD